MFLIAQWRRGGHGSPSLWDVERRLNYVGLRENEAWTLYYYCHYNVNVLFFNEISHGFDVNSKFIALALRLYLF